MAPSGGSSTSEPLGPTIDASELGGNVSQKSFAQAIARLQFSGGDQKKTADDLLKKYGANINPAFFQAAGVKMPSQHKDGGGFLGAVGGVLGPIANVLGRPAQVLQAGLRTAGVGLAEAVRGVTGLGHEPDTRNAGWSAISKAATGHGTMTPFTMVNPDKPSIAPEFAAGLERLGLGHAPGAGVAKAIAPGFFNFAAGAAYDPTIYAGGASKEVRAAQDILKEAGMGEEVAQIGRSGFRSMPADIRQGLSETIRNSEQVMNMAGRGGLQGAELTAAEEAKAAELVGALKGGGRRGVRFLGKTVIPTAPISEAANLVPGVEAARAAVRAGLDKLAPVISLPAKLARDIGQKGADVIAEGRRAMGAATNLSARDAITRFKPFMKLAEGEQAAIIRGMERGADYATVVRDTLSDEGKAAMDEFMAGRAENYASKEATAPVGDATVQRAFGNEKLAEVHTDAFNTAKETILKEMSAPLDKLQTEAERLRNFADNANARFDAHRIELMDKSNEVGLKKTYTWGPGKQFGKLKDQALRAETEAVAAEAKVAKVQGKIAAALDTTELGVAPIDKQATQIADEARDAFAKTHNVLKAEDTWIHHGFTSKGTKLFRQLAKKNPALAEKMIGDIKTLSSGGSLESRTIQMEIPDTNKLWADTFEAAGINTKGAQIVENNPAMILGGSQVAEARAASELDMLTKLSQTANKEGTANLIIAGDTVDPVTGEAVTAAERAKELGYVPVPSGDMLKTPMFAPRELLPHLKNLQAVTQNDAELKKIVDFFRQWDSQWSKYTTSLSMTKRYVGHIFNSALAGAANPEGFQRALKAQLADRAVRSDLAIARGSGPAWEKAMIEKLGQRDFNIYNNALKSGVGATGFMPQNIANTLEREMGRGGNLIPTSKNFRPLTKLGDINQAIDNNVRLGHYFNAFENTGSYKSASDSVYKYLFDYSELTPTEEKFKQYARFYTYLRKNTPLQVLGLIQHPGIYSTTFRAKRSLAEALPAGPGPFAQYALEAGGVPTSAGVLGMDMPLEHAAKFVQPALQLAAMTPGLQKIMPASLHPEGGFGEVVRGGASSIAGGPLAVAKVLVEQATGRSLSSGAPISLDTKHRMWQAVNQLVPVTSKANAVLHPRGGSIPLGVLGKLFNVNITPINSETKDAEYAREARVVADAIAKYNANGPQTVTMAELQAAGVAPSSAKAKSILKAANLPVTQNKKKLTAAQKRAAAMAKITLPG